MTDPQGAEALIRRLREHAENSQRGYSELFERTAEQFYQQTGFMAPGKSMPLEMQQSDDARERAWEQFNKDRKAQFIARAVLERDSEEALKAEKEKTDVPD